MKRALITGALGQDGSYLAEYLLSLGYEVWGTARIKPTLHENFNPRVKYEFMDLRDELSIASIIRKSIPNEIYNLAGQVFVPTSFLYPAETFDVNCGGLGRILNCLEKMKLEDTKVYQASTSEMFGNALSDTEAVKLNESSVMYPVSPYGVSKYAAHKLVSVYRLKGFYVCSGILFNHESPRRGAEMVTRKITRHVAQWVNGNMVELKLGNTLAKRDWGFAGDFIEAMHSMLQQPEPDDYVIGTGEAHSVQDFINMAIDVAGLSNMDRSVIRIDCPQYGRRPELHTLVADYSKAHTVLGWEPKHSFRELVTMMVNSDCKQLEKMSCTVK